MTDSACENFFTNVEAFARLTATERPTHGPIVHLTHGRHDSKYAILGEPEVLSLLMRLADASVTIAAELRRLRATTTPEA